MVINQLRVLNLSVEDNDKLTCARLLVGLIRELRIEDLVLKMLLKNYKK